MGSKRVCLSALHGRVVFLAGSIFKEILFIRGRFYNFESFEKSYLLL
jgi:hypothetical protein